MFNYLEGPNERRRDWMREEAVGGGRMRGIAGEEMREGALAADISVRDKDPP